MFFRIVIQSEAKNLLITFLDAFEISHFVRNDKLAYLNPLEYYSEIFHFVVFFSY